MKKNKPSLIDYWVEFKIYLSRAIGESGIFQKMVYLVIGLQAIEKFELDILPVIGIFLLYIIYQIFDFWKVFPKQLARSSTINPEINKLLKDVREIKRTMVRK